MPHLRCLRYVVSSGEALTAATVAAFHRCLSAARLINLYGSTEVEADVTCFEPEAAANVVLIGRPIANTRIYILDAHRRPVPMGVEGEIYIGGVGVARGYLNRPQLTAERFVEDAFSFDPQSRLYKTGDVGRWRPDGNIEFVGRNDAQVKIRGYRIELGEIEARLLEHARVQEAVVLAREDQAGEKRLVAYYTARERVGPEELRTHLQAVLPALHGAGGVCADGGGCR